MIMPTLLRVRKNSSSSSNAISGAGIFPFITPTSRICRGSTCPSKQGAVQFPAARLSASGVKPTAPFQANPPRVGATVSVGTAPSDVAGSPGAIVPGYTLLNTLGNSVPGCPLAISASPDNGPKENRSEEHTSELQS